MATSNYIFDTTNGTIQPSTGSLLVTVQDEYVEAFGADLVLNEGTPQDVLINAEVIARKTVINNNAQIGNQINPNLAGGTFLDAIGALTAFYRTQQTFSQVSITLAGIVGTVIPTSVTIADSNANIYQNLNSVTIGADGTITSLFQAVLPGPILTAASST